MLDLFFVQFELKFRTAGEGEFDNAEQPYLAQIRPITYTARLYLITYLLKELFLKRSVFTLGVIMDLFSLSRSDKT